MKKLLEITRDLDCLFIIFWYNVYTKEYAPTYTIKVRAANIPYTTLTKIESNVVRKPSVQNVAKIAKALRVNIEKLLEE